MPLSTYYQEMARVHFAVRAVERRAPDQSAVRPCFTAVVRSVRSEERPSEQAF